MYACFTFHMKDIFVLLSDLLYQVYSYLAYYSLTKLN